MDKLTVSFVGGGTGGRLSLDAVAASEYYQPAALADLRQEVSPELREKYPELLTFTDFREMFRTCPTDIVCVSTYPPSHELVTLAALKLALKAILVEKPLGHSVASGRRILEAVKQRRIPMAVPHGLMVKRCPLEIIGRTKAGIHWLNFAVNLNGQSPAHSVLAACDKTTRTFRDGMQVETVAVTYVQMANGVRIVIQTGDTIRSNGRETERHSGSSVTGCPPRLSLSARRKDSPTAPVSQSRSILVTAVRAVTTHLPVGSLGPSDPSGYL